MVTSTTTTTGFFTRDPIKYAGGWNLTSFCINTPLASVDPEGLRDCSAEQRACNKRAMDNYIACKADPAQRLCDFWMTLDMKDCWDDAVECLKEKFTPNNCPVPMPIPIPVPVVPTVPVPANPPVTPAFPKPVTPTQPWFPAIRFPAIRFPALPIYFSPDIFIDVMGGGNGIA